jgi:hypothetical protein
LSASARAATTVTFLLAVVLCGPPREARADYLFAPFIGSAFSGSAVFPFVTAPEVAIGSAQDTSSQHLIFGGAAGWLSSGIVGFEGDFAFAPRFFESDDPSSVILGSTLFTVSGSVIAAVPLSVSGYSLRPYVIGGLGLMHSGITYIPPTPVVDDNSLGFNVGGGAIGFFTPRTGVRFELRHFRTFEREPNDFFGDVRSRLSFWRFTVGVVIRR